MALHELQHTETGAARAEFYDCMLKFSRLKLAGMERHERIEKAIALSGKKKGEIAKACGVANSAVTQWISGESKSLKPENLYALAEATGYSARWLAIGEGPEKDLGPYLGPAGAVIDVVAPAYALSKRYQDAPEEVKATIDELAQQMLGMTPEQKDKLKAIMELLDMKSDGRAEG